MVEALVPAAIEAFHGAREIRSGARPGGIFLGNGAVSVVGEGLAVLVRATAVGLLGAEIYNLGKINYELIQVCF